jgi:hypothetical protein
MKKAFFSVLVVSSAILLTACTQQTKLIAEKNLVSVSPTTTASPSLVASPSAEKSPSPELLTATNEKSDQKNVITYTCLKNETALSALQKGNHQVETKQYSFGKTVISIDGKEQGNNKYWLFAINGQEATVGAEAYKCTGTEKITWELK